MVAPCRSGPTRRSPASASGVRSPRSAPRCIRRADAGAAPPNSMDRTDLRSFADDQTNPTDPSLLLHAILNLSNFHPERRCATGPSDGRTSGLWCSVMADARVSAAVDGRPTSSATWRATAALATVKSSPLPAPSTARRRAEAPRCTASTSPPPASQPASTAASASPPDSSAKTPQSSSSAASTTNPQPLCGPIDWDPAIVESLRLIWRVPLPGLLVAHPYLARDTRRFKSCSLLFTDGLVHR
jgi:hypothetical protein